MRLPEIRALPHVDLMFYLRALRRRAGETQAASEGRSPATYSGPDDMAPDRLTLAAEEAVLRGGI